MKLKNKTYDILKWVLLILTPAVELLITTLGGLYNFDTKLINGTISAVATFLGALIGVSSSNYNKNK